jgi:hypothetical protein
VYETGIGHNRTLGAAMKIVNNLIYPRRLLIWSIPDLSPVTELQLQTGRFLL